MEPVGAELAPARDLEAGTAAPGEPTPSPASTALDAESEALGHFFVSCDDGLASSDAAPTPVPDPATFFYLVLRQRQQLQQRLICVWYWQQQRQLKRPVLPPG